MPPAPTPPPHVPVSYLKKGGAAFFSDRCIKLLTKLGFEMEEFGTYKSCDKYMDQCRKRRADYDAGKPVNPPLSRREYELGEPTKLPPPNQNRNNPLAYQSGHLMMDATQRQTGGRGHACANTVDGHQVNDYPCIPHQGPAYVENGTHNRNTALEYNQARANGAQTGGNYANASTPQEAATQAQRDATKRSNHTMQRRRGELQQPTSQRLNTGRSPHDTRKPVSGKVDNLDPVSKPKAVDRAPKDHVVDGTSAEKCVDNFHKMGAEGMRQQCVQDIDKNQAKADAAGVTPADHASAVAAHDAARANLRAVKAQYPANSPQVQAAAATSRAAAGRVAACNAACLAEQGRRLRDGNGRNNPVAPDPGEGTPGTTDSPTQTFMF